MESHLEPPQPEIFVSTDIEADGPVPGLYSMLSFASVAYTADHQRIADFSANLKTLPDAGQHADTMEWWKEFPEAWAAHRENTEEPATAMRRYSEWLENLPGTPVFVAYPACVDFMFIYWYLHKFVGHSPFGFVALDLKTLALAMMDVPFHSIRKKNMPQHWFAEGTTNSHLAIDDAEQQGEMFFRMLNEIRQK